jgi:hypothetical protein
VVTGSPRTVKSIGLLYTNKYHLIIAKLMIGQPLQVLVKSADQEGRVISLSMDKEKAKSAMVSLKSSSAFQNLL